MGQQTPSTSTSLRQVLKSTEGGGTAFMKSVRAEDAAQWQQAQGPGSHPQHYKEKMVQTIFYMKSTA